MNELQNLTFLYDKNESFNQSNHEVEPRFV